MSDDKISFSKEVAETLSIESAIILQKTKENKYKNISSIDKLITALKNGDIAAAGIDVTDPEPLPSSSELWGIENVILTPHTGGETRLYEDNVLDILIENIQRLERGETDLLNQIV